MNTFLHEKDNFIYSLLDRLHEGIIIHSSNTTIVYANEAASVILGLSKEQILGKNATDSAWYFIDSKHNQIPQEQYPVNLIFSNGENLDHYLIGLHLPEGEIRWVDINGTIVSNDNNEKVALIMFSDVTAREKAYKEALLFKQVVEAIDTGVTISDPTQADNPLIYVNRAFSAMTGYLPHEAIGKNCRYLQSGNTQQPGRYIIADAIKNKTSCNTELFNYTKEGKPFYNLLTLSPLFENENVKYFVGVQHDITHLKEQEDLLAERNLYIQSLLDAQDDIVIVSDGKKLLYCNRIFLDFFAVGQLDEFLENETSIYSKFLEEEGFYAHRLQNNSASWIEEMMQLPASQRIISLHDTLKEIHYFMVTIKILHSGHYIITLSDTTRSILKERLLAQKAYHDPLTGAYNRQYFYEYLSQDTAHAGVIMIDLDNFKLVNDTYGHAIGDQVLIETVKVIIASIRKEDYVIRWGGEEILVLSHSQNADQLQHMAENIRYKIESYPIQTAGKITASLGSAMIEGSIENAIKKADQALYQAKKMGRNKAQHHFE